MRLIDADELMEHIWREKTVTRDSVARIVWNAPTVKDAVPLRTAKWVYHRPHHWFCSGCGFMEGRLAMTDCRMYCPVCGAKMEKPCDAEVMF